MADYPDYAHMNQATTPWPDWASNFYVVERGIYVPIVDAIVPTTEHAYQAAKAVDPEDRKWVLDSVTPGEAKRRGRLISCRSDWDLIKDEIMMGILRAKFGLPELRSLLIAHETPLVEWNWWKDTYWGVCIGPGLRGHSHPHPSGLNRLGHLLMQLRTEFLDANAL